jgi:hypothetical protein
MTVAAQLSLWPTDATRAGEAAVSQCSWCGLLAAHDATTQLGECPACRRAIWWPQDVPVAPFVDRATLDHARMLLARSNYVRAYQRSVALRQHDPSDEP